MKRHWVKLWVNEWLDGTTRFQMTGAQRAFWTDLLAMAGRSRFPGIVCSGRDGDSYVGYPLTTFAALDPGTELDIQATFELFVATGKIAVEVTAEKPVKLFKVSITNWSKYQSEYQRQKPYQETYRRRGKKLSSELTPELSPNLTANYLLEGEVEVRSEKEKKAQAETRPSPSLAFSGAHLQITEQQDRTLSQAFPWVDRQAEYRRMDSWLEANPTRRVRKHSQFAHNWFSKIPSPSAKGGSPNGNRRTSGAVQSDRQPAFQPDRTLEL